MCKELCEQSEEGRRLWARWRTQRDNWRQVSVFHREAVLAAMRADAARSGQCTVFLCPREEGEGRRPGAATEAESEARG